MINEIDIMETINDLVVALDAESSNSVEISLDENLYERLSCIFFNKGSRYDKYRGAKRLELYTMNGCRVTIQKKGPEEKELSLEEKLEECRKFIGMLAQNPFDASPHDRKSWQLAEKVAYQAFQIYHLIFKRIP